MALLTLRERCQKRLASLKNLRTPFEPEAMDIARYAAPARSRFQNSDTNKPGRVRNKALYSNHGITSFRTLTGGMTSGLTSSSRPWFQLATQDEEMMDEPDVREWLTEVTRRMYVFLAHSNFYGAAKTGYTELGLFGTEACVMVEDMDYGLVFHALTFGEYWIGLNKSNMVDTLYRRVPMSAIQAIQSFGYNRVRAAIRTAYDSGNYEMAVDVVHAIEPNIDRDPKMLDRRGMEYRSVWWDEQDDALNTVSKDALSDGDDMRGLLRNKGYPEKPFWAARWDTTGADAWGTGPGADALPDLRELQLQSKRKAEATDQLVWPEIVVPTGVKLRRQPKSVVAAAGVDLSGIAVPYKVPYQAVEAIKLDIDKCEENIDDATYAQLFMAITNMQGIQPRNVQEIASRNEEKLTQLGPVIERVNTEKLEVAIDRSFAVMGRMGMIPEAPESIQGNDLKINFVSILTQMQRMIGIGQIERTVGFIGNLAAVFPSAADKLNTDEVIDDYADRAGAPQKIIRTQAEVDAIRERAAAQQQMAQMAAMAGPAKDGAEAARLLSETDATGASVMDRIMPQ